VELLQTPAYAAIAADSPEAGVATAAARHQVKHKDKERTNALVLHLAWPSLLLAFELLLAQQQVVEKILHIGKHHHLRPF
jgi:hypothetical protein